MSRDDYFATFGSGQLQNFNIDPMSIMVFIPGATEAELRERLQQEPFDNKYCTTYPAEPYYIQMTEQYNMSSITVDDLLKLEK